MAEKLVLKDGKEPNEYILETVLGRSEPHKGEYPCKIGVFHEEPIDGCWVIKLNQSQDYNSIAADLGIVRSKEEIPDKVYECAVKAGEKYAEKLGCELVDETKKGLEKLAQSKEKVHAT